MALRDWFKKTTPLQLALERGLQAGGDVAAEVRQLGDYTVKNRADGEAICRALEKIAHRAVPAARTSFSSPLHAVTGLFQDVADAECDTFAVLREQGCALLTQIVDDGLRDDKRYSADDLLFALKMLAMYGTREGTETVIRAARLPLRPDGYMWSVILQVYEKEHPLCERLFEALADPLPPGFLAVSVLDAANRLKIEGSEVPHPFDSDEGKRRLEQWLRDSEPEHFSYAHSATAALPFISTPERNQLLSLAFDHPSAEVQLEAAWAGAKLGLDAGLKCLARYCCDVNHSHAARRYLAELNREDLIPPEASDPDFKAKAAFAEWLAHPNELGRPPDAVEIIDHRKLDWPPNGERKPFWLVKYRVAKGSVLEEDDEDVGVVGSVTFCLFTYRLAERPPEDAYAIHCCWEMEGSDLIKEMEVDEGSHEYDSMLRQWEQGALEAVKITHVAEMSPELNYPQRLVALATARFAGEDGWVVLDGPRIAWYGRSEMPDAHATTVLKVHIGRELLGVRDRPDRKRFLAPDRPKPSPEQVIGAYERLLDEACRAGDRQQKLLCERSLLVSRFNVYIEARQARDACGKASVVVQVYERLLSAARGLAEPLRGKAFDSFQFLGEHFDLYRDALIELGRQSELRNLVTLFEPYWDHNLGYGTLASAAYHAGDHDVAERFCLKLRSSAEYWYRSEEMAYLAEIWCRRGRAKEAKELLLTCLQEVLTTSRKAKGSDKRLHEKEFQQHRAAYLRLFPDGGENELQSHGIPATTLS
jgi:hypothetical protein